MSKVPPIHSPWLTTKKWPFYTDFTGVSNIVYADLCEYKSLHLHINQYILRSNLKSSGQGQGVKLYRMMSHHNLYCSP